MKERIAIINGLRSPIAKANGKLKNLSADNLGAMIAKEVVLQSGIDYKQFDEIIIGNVAQPTNAANMARVLAIKAGFDIKTPAFTVNRNCASGMQAISSAIEKIHSGKGDLFLVGGVESMSNIPLLYSDRLRDIFITISQSKSPLNKLHALLELRPKFLKPIIGLLSGLTDPISGEIMGMTAERLAGDFKISRESQDQFALNSHLKAEKAIKDGVFKDEIHPIVTKKETIFDDDGIRFGQTIEALQKLRPIFDRTAGSVTAGNSSQVSDGACMMIVCKESYAKEKGYEPIGYINEYTYVGLEAERMGLGPVFATKKLFDLTNTTLEDIDIFEINEAFAAQVLANLRAFESQSFADQYFKGEILGSIDESKLNINGGAVALGHPVGMSGARIVLTAIKQLQRDKKQLALATLCIGGGQGSAFLLERQ